MRLNPFLLLLAVLSVPLSALSAAPFQGKKLIFAIEEIETAFSEEDSGLPDTDRTGIFYFCNGLAFGECERGSLVGYKLRNGKVIGSPAGNSELLEDLKAMPLSSFDVQKEIDSTIARLEDEARKNHTGVPRWITTDGAKYRIFYDFNGVYIDYTDWNPRLGIEILAAYSPNMKNLYDLLERIALDFGLRQLW